VRKVFEELQKEEVSLPILGRKAPEFEALTTQDTLTLPDYEGIWLVLFSHPADFTPVCTTEFIAFSEIYEELKNRSTAIRYKCGQCFFPNRMDKKHRGEDGR